MSQPRSAGKGFPAAQGNAVDVDPPRRTTRKTSHPPRGQESFPDRIFEFTSPCRVTRARCSIAEKGGFFGWRTVLVPVPVGGVGDCAGGH